MIPEWITPNHITLFRMLATPFTVALLYDRHYALGIPVFLIVAFSDALDGAMARTRSKITQWGMMFDPFADKMLIIPCVIVLVFAHLNAILAASIVGIEILIMILALLWRKGGGVVQANGWGKVKMFLQVLGIAVLLFSARFSSPELLTAASVILAASILFGVASILKRGI